MPTGPLGLAYRLTSWPGSGFPRSEGQTLERHSHRGSMLRRRTRVLSFVAAVAVLGAPPAVSAQAASATLFRIFLSDPHEIASLVSYGEYTRLDDQVVFSLPVGDITGSPRLQLVSIPAAAVDWPATERYARSARYASYVAGRAEADFSAMSMDVAEALNQIALTENPEIRLRVAEDARRTLVAWPQAHFGYRSDDIRGYVGLLDEIISEMRVSTGTGSFDLSFVASPPPPTELLQPRPGLMESLQQAFVAAELTRTPAERISLLQSILSVLESRRAYLDPGQARELRTHATDLLGDEERIGQAYASLAQRVLIQASGYARDADVRGVERVLHSIDAEDERLGRARRPAIVSLRLAVEHTLDETRALRLAQDQWRARRDGYERYEKAIRGPLRRLASVEPLLDDVKALAGPDLSELDDLERQLMRATRELAEVTAPPGVEAIHSLVTTAFQYAESAVQKRRRAVADGDMRTAWDASSAAAAAMMLRIQVQERLERLLTLPQLR